MKLIFFLAGICFWLAAGAQSKNSFYALDANMNQTTLDSSKYILWIHEKEDSNWQWDYYATWGPLIKSQSFLDFDGTILNGRSCIYNVAGNLDSLSMFDHGKRNGSFYKYKTITEDSVITIMQYDYSADSLLRTIDLLAGSGANKITDTTGTESEYPGGITAWNAFLNLNLTFPERAMKHDLQGTVKVFFMVDKDGKVKEPYIFRSVEYSLDQESIRVIRKSGTWEPAFQNGDYKKSYKLMPVRFSLQ